MDPSSYTYVYAATRNLYPALETALKSLFCNTPVGVAVLLLEDDELPVEDPIGRRLVGDLCQVINVKDQTFFPPDGPNYRSFFTYMTLMKTVVSKLLPETRRVVFLDVDTIVLANISSLFRWDLSGAAAGMVHEYNGIEARGFFPYYNAGVMVMDLDVIRDRKLDDAAVARLNAEEEELPEQDVINDIWPIFPLPRVFNSSTVTEICSDPRIVHFAGFINWQTSKIMPQREHLERYRAISWEAAAACRTVWDIPPVGGGLRRD